MLLNRYGGVNGLGTQGNRILQICCDRYVVGQSGSDSVKAVTVARRGWTGLK